MVNRKVQQAFGGPDGPLAECEGLFWMQSVEHGTLPSASPASASSTTARRATRPGLRPSG